MNDLPDTTPTDPTVSRTLDAVATRWSLGVRLDGDGGGTVLVWAPQVERVQYLRYARAAAETTDPRTDAEGVAEVVDLQPLEYGYHGLRLDDVRAGDRYRFRLHRAQEEPVDRADPASRSQPQGVHGPSAVDDPGAFPWSDAGFAAPPLHEQVIYELHVGTFSPAGTFDGAVAQLDHLVELGVTTIELMPVWQFPGGRNWGYDGVLAFAVQDSYGGPDGLRRFVDAAHGRGLAVILDVVHNHFGPEGNHLGDFGPYLSAHRMTPWGAGLNTDGPLADGVRRYVTEHLVSFIGELHLDGFRLDAVHGIVDQSATHLLEQLATAVHAEAERLGRPVHLIAESDLCDARLVRDPQAGGYGLDAQWADDLHHAVHVALTGERDGYYLDHTGLGDLEHQLRDRYVHAGRYSAFRQRTLGRPAPDVPYDRYVVCVQNHDQTGNRMLGERLTALTDVEGLKFAAAVLLTTPFVPMLFMGEEHAESAPFQYFVSHTDPELIEAVRTGRREEFAYFADHGVAPDPQDEATFERSKVDIGLARRESGDHARLFALYRELIALRRWHALLHRPDAPDPIVTRAPGAQALALHRAAPDGDAVLCVYNAEPDEVTLTCQAPGPWAVALATAEERWGGPGPIQHPEVVADGTVRLRLAPRSALILVRPDRLPPARASYLDAVASGQTRASADTSSTGATRPTDVTTIAPTETP